MVDVEKLLIDAINAVPDGVRAFADVPAERPKRFITVERVSGPESLLLGRPSVAIQCWADSRYKASELAYGTATLLQSLWGHPNVGKIDVSNIYNFPDPDSRHPRYQLTVNLVTKD